MKITVTGSSGFIGQHVCALAVQRGHEVIEFDRSVGSDVLDFAAGDCGDAVIHLAGSLGTAELFDKADEAVSVNVLGSLRVIEACAATDSHLVMITMPQVWKNVYQATKACAHALADAYMVHEGLRVTHVRAFNVYGEGQHVLPVRKIIPTFATAGWRGEPIEVWGSGESLVDLIRVEDMARFLVEAAERAPGNGEVIEAGSGLGVPVNEVADLVRRRTGDLSEIVHVPMRKGEAELTVDTVADPYPDPTLGIVKVARLDELLDTIDWYREDRP